MGFHMMELRSVHTSQCGFEGDIKECMPCAWNTLIDMSVDHSFIVVAVAAARVDG